MKTFNPTHAGGWRGFNFGRNEGVDFSEGQPGRGGIEEDFDAYPTKMASSAFYGNRSLQLAERSR